MESDGNNKPLYAGPGFWLCLGGAVLWGTTGSSQALAPEGARPETIGAMRLAVGGTFLLVMALLRGYGPEMLRLPKKELIIAVLCTAAYQLCFFWGVAKTGIAVGTMVGIGSSPIWGGVLGFIFRGERPRGMWFLATALAIGGCVLLVGGGEGGIGVDPLGLLLALGAGGTYAMFSVSSKDMLDEFPPDAVMAMVFFGGGLLLAPLLLTADMKWLLQPRGAAVAVHLGVLATGVSYMLYSRGLKRVSVATATTLALGEPLTAGLLGVFLIGESLSGRSLAGVALLFTGLALLAFGSKARRVSS